MKGRQWAAAADDQPASPAAWAILIVLSLIWGSSYVLIKRGLEAYEPEMVAGLRVLVTFLCLLPFGLYSLKAVRRKHIFPLALVGLIGTSLPAFLFSLAQTMISSSVAGILNSMTPLFTLVVAAFLFRVRFGLRSVAGILVGLLGAVLIIGARAGVAADGNALYGLFVVLATIAYAFSTTFIKYRLADLKPVQTMSLAMMFAAPPYIIYLLVQAGDFWTITTTSPAGMSSLTAILILGSFGTAFAIVLFARLIQMCSPLFAVSVTYTMPVVSLMWGVWDGESISIWQVVGLCTILGGVYLVNQRQTKKVIKASSPSEAGVKA